MLEPKRLRTQVASVVEPEDIHVSWFDISNPDAPVLKIYYDGAWRPIGGGEGPSGTAESTANKVTEISAESTDIQYPSAKAVYTALQSSAPADIFFSGTHAEVKGLRDSGTLVPGALYKITDYVATTTQLRTQSANHPFDIIVRATAPDTLSEEALAAPHEGDTYFTGLDAKLEAWRLMYCIDNDINRFEWADDTNGKGVVYRMIDEWGNDVPYDFKGILILRDAAFWASNAAATALAEDTFGTQTPGKKSLYLFSAVDGEGNILDASSTRISAVIEDEPAGLISCRENVFAGFGGGYTDDGECIYAIANNVFLAKISDEDWDHSFSVCLNTFPGTVYDNTFSGTMYDNIFSGNIYDNIFSGEVESNIFSGHVSRSTFSGGMTFNAFYGNVYDNAFSAYMEANTFSGFVSDNIFSGLVSRNTFSGDIGHNTFSDDVVFNTFSGFLARSTFSGYVGYNIFDGAVSPLILQGSGNNYMENCRIHANLSSGLTLVSTGQEPPGQNHPAEFDFLTITGDCYNQAQGQTVQVQKYSSYEQVITADADGILHVHPIYSTPMTVMPQSGFEPGVLYELGSITAIAVTFLLNTSLESVRGTNHYFWTFSISGYSPNIIWPANIVWEGGSAPTADVGYEYHISILNGRAICSKFQL